MPDGDRTTPRPAAQVMPLGDAEPPVVCPRCQQPVPARDFQRHLSRAHHLYAFRGIRYEFPDALAALLQALVTRAPDPEAWRTLVAAARMEHGAGADDFLAGVLGRALRQLPDDDRPRVSDALARLLAAEADAPFVAALASDSAAAAQHLALLVVGHRPPPVERVLFQPVSLLLMDRRLPTEAQFAAAGPLLRSVPPKDPWAAEFLQTLVSGLGKKRSIDRLRELEGRVGSHAAIDAFCARLEDRLRMTCPRCNVELRRPAMARHLWKEHRLVLDGRRVRDPWSVIEECVDDYRAGKNPDLLERCRALAQRVDAEHGLLRLERLLLARGLDDPEARAALLEEAADAHAALCPWCFGLAPVPREVPPFTLHQQGGRLGARGYHVEVSERGWQTRLEAAAPGRVVFRGGEPGRRWTARGATAVFVGPFVLLALACAAALPDNGTRVLRTVLALLGSAAVVYVGVLYAWHVHVPLLDRLRNYAWTVLAPALHAGGFRLEDSAFLAGLARRSMGDHTYAHLRWAVLPGLLATTEEAVRAGRASPSHLAALRRLAVSDAAEAAGADPVPLLADELARCFDGRLPLAVADHLLAGWEPAWWTEGNVARLRILLCDRAFGAGFEVRNLLDAARTCPALAEVLHTADPHRLAALRLLWSLRPTRPWDRCGDADTAFDLAEDRGNAALLGRHPDLLLYHVDRSVDVVGDGGKGRMGPAEIVVGAGGVSLQEVTFTESPGVVEVRGKNLGHELKVGDRWFRAPQPLEDLARRLERWMRYAFRELLPAAREALAWRPPDRSALLRAWGAVPCPECGRYLLARAGEVGLAPEEESAGPAGEAGRRPPVSLPGRGES
jgi:hypothetical protein